MRFAKYQGLGNDFLVVDLRTVSRDDAAAWQDPKTVVALCDRQFGVGGDGVLAILPSQIADARMRVLNSDGSEAEMCGNGLRCVAKELYDRLGPRKRELVIETGNGPLPCTIDDAGVTVQMGAPKLSRGEIPVVGPADERCIEQPFELAGQPTRPLTAVNMGNPHAVTVVGSRDEAWQLATTIGPIVEKHAWFPKKTNVEYAHVVTRGKEIDLVVWERGCGLTLACGTGACATTVAAVLTGRADEGVPVKVNLPGGSLEITVLPGFANVLMKGPATLVFDGELDPRRVAPRPIATK